MSLSKNLKHILSLLFPSFSSQIERRIEIRKELRSVHGKKVDATYDIETGQILIWGDLKLDDIDLIIILMHEIGHLLFHEVLTENERSHWVKINELERLDFGLEEDYALLQIPEETFSCLCSILGVLKWLERKGMKEKTHKTRNALKNQSPQGHPFVEEVIENKINRLQSPKTQNSESKKLYHSTVKKIRNWIEEKTGPLK